MYLNTEYPADAITREIHEGKSKLITKSTLALLVRKYLRDAGAILVVESLALTVHSHIKPSASHPQAKLFAVQSVRPDHCLQLAQNCALFILIPGLQRFMRS